MEKILKKLNKEQIEAVKTTEGYIRLIAGPGSGKTRVLTHRFAYLVNELEVSGTNILCATFTNKAANEMKTRIRELIGDKDIGNISTFHSFCVKVLREDINKIYYPKNFMIIDMQDIDTILSSIYKDLNINSRNMTYRQAKSYISDKKKNQKYLEYLIKLDNKELREKYENAKSIEDKVYYGYLYEQKKCYGLDFNDLINFVLYIFKNYDEVTYKWQKRLEYIMVDEFQDVSSSQYKLVTILSDYHKNLFIVGDPDQTIYSWRGAKVEYILNFDKEFKNVETLFLNRNYRSTPNIIDASNSLICKNKNRIDKELIPTKNKLMPAIYNHEKTLKLEAKWIVDQINILLKSGRNLKDIAILYRAHYISREIEEALMKENIDYVLYSGVEFYERKEIKDILSYLRLIVYSDNISFLRVANLPKRGIGLKRMDFIKKYADENNCSLYIALKENIGTKLLSNTGAKDFINLIERYKEKYKEYKISDLLTSLLEKTGYEEMLRLSGDQERLDNLAELKQSIQYYEEIIDEEHNLEDYLDQIALFTNIDKKEKNDSVKLMTIHAAKGLEFQHVFVCALNEGIFPSRNIKSKEELEEERRLAYVACTRAENTLFLSSSEGRTRYNSYAYPSRFIFNIERKHLHYINELDDSLVEEAKSYISKNIRKLENQSTFKVGDIIIHKSFGRGKIIDINETSDTYVIKFDEVETNRNLNLDAELTYG